MLSPRKLLWDVKISSLSNRKRYAINALSFIIRMSLFPEELTSTFEVKDHQNFGTYGAIYRAIKRSNRKMYAMKAVVRADTGSSWKDIETEMQVLSWVNPYKLHLDSFFVSGNTFFMVIDYCRNGNLLKAIADKIEDHELFKEDEIWKYFIQICFGLESLRYNGFIHQDLHPQNILLDENKDIKIADFGISCSLPIKTVQGVINYQSPETHCGDIQAEESDVWAVGCILYHLCNLEEPFDLNVNKIGYEPHKPIRSEYSNELRYFVDWCLKKQQTERPKILDILTHEFIINKTLSLGITIPQTSAINAAICQIQLNKERERNEQLENELSKYRKESMVQKTEIEWLKEEIARLDSIINESSKILKGSENVKDTENEENLLNSQIITITNDLSGKLNEAESALNAIDTLRNKKAEILSMPNNPELEMDFRATCSAYQSNSNLYDPPLMQAYQDYLNAYQQKTSLYNVTEDAENNRTNLVIYNTETEVQEEVRILQTPELLNWNTCITQLPNGKLFCFGRAVSVSGITLLIDVNGGVEELPSGTPCFHSSCLYFNNSVYCFGGYNGKNLTLSSRFDLHQKRWIQLTPMPRADYACSSIAFNGNILISGLINKNLLLYSIDINSFSIIPYEYADNKVKILINAGRLYLIECENGSIYESEIASYTNWKRIGNSIIDYNPCQVYCSYNKGFIFIGAASDYYKFDLNGKLIRIL
ncbi:unnamed protein product [Blepharisma stoltei]|uniref:non-specific serine/threonine protein kinase n=1 Tax=Blepharisma stoltei TaxID=1481888 RepID=A0AAU9IUQ5_9CILI|nr:unnamed protein product [Blepharisma stoltei]